MELDVISPRPLAEAALVLEERFGSIVTYEDAPYYHPDDMIQDEGGRIIPRGGQIVVQYQEDDDLSEILDRTLEVHARSGYPGVFAVEERMGTYHIVPCGFRNASGLVERRHSLLDTMISLSSQARSGLQLVEGIVWAVSESRGESISLGMLPVNVFMQHVSTVVVSKEKAQDLLISLFREMGLRLSWQLLNDPRKAVFYLNIHQLSGQEIDMT